MNKPFVSGINVLIHNNSLLQNERKFLQVYKNPHQYSFLNNHIFLETGSQTKLVKVDSCSCFIHGELYDPIDRVKRLLAKFTHDTIDESEISTINGSFIILVVNEKSGSIHVITDRINSRKIYYFNNGNIIALTTNPSFFKSFTSKINLSGLASYLINGVVYNNHTLYDGIKALERSSIHTIHQDVIFSRPYWRYTFTNEYAQLSRNEIKKKFADLLIKSVEKRIQSIKPDVCFLSLSGGYDSRFLLGSLRKNQDHFQLKAFSYGTIEKFTMGDDAIASELAKKFDLEYRFVNAFSSHILDIINLNADLGYGLPNFCDEIEAWHNLGPILSQNPLSLLFVGDMFAHSSPKLWKVIDKRVPMRNVKIFPWQYIKPLLHILPQQNRKNIIDAYEDMYSDMLNRLPDTDDYQIIKDFAYLDQRISHTLMYWREFFSTPHIKVATPLLDNDLLDFFRKLPTSYRFNKILYKEIVKEMFPDLFEVPLAQNLWKGLSYSQQFTKHFETIRKELHTTKSQLDDLIHPSIIETLIGQNTYDKGFRPVYGYKYLNKISQQNDSFNYILKDVIINNTFISKEILILRLLILRKILKV